MKDMQLRVWDKNNKEMYENQKNDTESAGIILTNKKTEHTINIRDTLNNPDNHVIMQFIEIKDINDKDTYEGDRVKCSTRYNKVDIEHIGIVLFERGAFIVGADTFTDSYMTFIELNSDWDLEVIGHKYDGE